MNSAKRTLCLIGCGKMGSAILRGWLENDILPVANIFVQEHYPSDELLEMQNDYNFWLNSKNLPEHTDTIVLAVKPQMMADVLEDLSPMTAKCYVSVAAGLNLPAYEKILGVSTQIMRVMPNTPVSVARGVCAIIGNAACNNERIAYTRSLFESIGHVVELESEDQMDAVTGVSGSGPAYVFSMIEAFAAAGEAEGLSPELSMTLARQTVCGAGELAYKSHLTATQLREMVTSPNGTTAAGLSVLRADDGIGPLMKRTVSAAAERSREMN